MVNWLTVVEEQSGIVCRMAQDVPKALRDPNLTPELASKVSDLVNRGAHEYYDLVDLMQQESDPDCKSLMDVAERLKAIWSGLTVMVARRLRAIHELRADRSNQLAHG